MNVARHILASSYARYLVFLFRSLQAHCLPRFQLTLALCSLPVLPVKQCIDRFAGQCVPQMGVFVATDPAGYLLFRGWDTTAEVC
jgi:hypothetical protein